MRMILVDIHVKPVFVVCHTLYEFKFLDIMNFCSNEGYH